MNLSTGRWESWGYAIGLALLYTSAFYLPATGVPQNYWLPNITGEILFPATIGTMILAPVAQVILLRYLHARNWNLIEQVAVIGLAVIALIGGFSAVGYSATDLIIRLTGSDATVDATRWSRIATYATVFVVVGAALAALKGRREAFIRILSTLGYTYAILAILRAGHSSISPALAAGTAPTIVSAATDRIEPLTRPREVIWIIFDEMDYNQTLGSPSVQRAKSMPNLYILSKLGVSAAQAYPPARDTECPYPASSSAFHQLG